jgi:hypothetical protein
VTCDARVALSILHQQRDHISRKRNSKVGSFRAKNEALFAGLMDIAARGRRTVLQIFAATNGNAGPVAEIQIFSYTNEEAHAVDRLIVPSQMSATLMAMRQPDVLSGSCNKFVSCSHGKFR